jgi:nucleoside-diphosphate-sugar epimerase
MHVLVAGGSIFVGRAIVDHLMATGHRVSVLNRGTRPVPGAQQWIADFDDPASIGRALAGARFDAVVDLTSSSAVHVDALCDALGGRVSRWLYVSSAAVYCEDGRYPMPESHPLGRSAAWGEYGLEKLSAERRLCERVQDRPLFVLRPPYVYGPHNPAPREHWLWARLLAGRPVLIPGRGETPLQFLHADDLGAAVASALAADVDPTPHIYNVGQSDWGPINAYLEVLAQVSGTSLRTREVPYAELGVAPREFFPFRDYPCVLDPTRIERELGFEPARSLESGFAETFASCDPERLVSHLDTAAEDQILRRLDS